MSRDPLTADQLVSLWAQYVNEGNVNALVNLYDDDTGLLPTFSPSLVNSPEELTDYFTMLGEKAGLKLSLDERKFSCNHIGNNSYIVTGFYTFEFEVNGLPIEYPARFTFVLDLNREKPILQHHSSVVPQPLN